MWPCYLQNSDRLDFVLSLLYDMMIMSLQKTFCKEKCPPPPLQTLAISLVYSVTQSSVWKDSVSVSNQDVLPMLYEVKVRV